MPRRLPRAARGRPQAVLESTSDAVNPRRHTGCRARSQCHFGRSLQVVGRGQLLIIPNSELTYFPDAIEWLNNSEHDCDVALFAGTTCQIYDALFSSHTAWISVARRIDDDAPVPYMICLVASGGIVVQVPMPLCLRDQDLDGRSVWLPDPPLSLGDRPAFGESRRAVLALGESPRASRHVGTLHHLMC